MILRIFLFFLYFLAATLVLKIIVTPGFIVGDERADTLAIMEGKAWTPFQYRVFMPFIGQQIVEILPNGFKEKLEKYVESAGRFREWRVYNIPTSRFVPATVMLSLSLLCFLGSFYLWRALAYYYYPNQQLLNDFCPLLGALLINLFFRYYSYPYDPMTIFISTLMFYLITKEQWWTFAPVFLIALFCRESSVLFLFLAFLRPKVKSRSFYIYLTALFLCALAVRIYMPIYYANNGHVGFEWDNLEYLSRYPTSIGYLLFMFGFIGFLAFTNWVQKDRFLKQSFLSIFIPLSILMVFVGRIDEFRVLLEGFPILLMLTFSTILSLYPEPRA